MKSRIALTACLVILLTTRAFAERPPAQLIDLGAWKLTLPYNTDLPGDPDEVLQPDLAWFADPDCFHASASGDAVVFRAACDGRQTVNSRYPRSELREMQAGGEDEIAWATHDDRSHTLEFELAVTQIPRTKNHVVCAQIHDNEDDVLMLRVEGEKLLIERNGADDIRLSRSYRLGDRIPLKIVAAKGRIRAWWKDRPVMDWETDREGCYFKVGCYTQSNRDLEQEEGSYGEVVLYRLSVSHEPADPRR